LNVEYFYNTLKLNGAEFFCGVPDSLLKDFCNYIQRIDVRHIVSANEGNAIALAVGHYLATGKIAVVYMQNSGLGNCTNPLISLADEEVYNIPLLMIIGLRGEPGTKDEPQHIKQGKITDKLLDVMGIKYSFLGVDDSGNIITDAFKYMKVTKKPYALLVRKGAFQKYDAAPVFNMFDILREDAIKFVAKNLSKNDIVIATTGCISRELYQYRDDMDEGHAKDFLTVGSMGHASSIAAAIALAKPERNIVCFDGDGAALMHMGAFPVIASLNLPNFWHIIFNNQAHDSVGGLPNASCVVDYKSFALACGYKYAYCVEDMDTLGNILPCFLKTKGTALLEIKVKCGARANLIRPKEAPCENKNAFISFINEGSR
jgi:phosphonopyruvate decarboxylase